MKNQRIGSLFSLLTSISIWFEIKLYNNLFKYCLILCFLYFGLEWRPNKFVQKIGSLFSLLTLISIFHLLWSKYGCMPNVSFLCYLLMAEKMGMLLIVVTPKEQRMHFTQTICANMLSTLYSSVLVLNYVTLPCSVFIEYSYWLVMKWWFIQPF